MWARSSVFTTVVLELLAFDWLHILFWGSNSHIVIGPVVNPCILLVYVDDISSFSRLNNNIHFRMTEMFEFGLSSLVWCFIYPCSVYA